MTSFIVLLQFDLCKNLFIYYKNKFSVLSSDAWSQKTFLLQALIHGGSVPMPECSLIFATGAYAMECKITGPQQRPYYSWSWFFEVKTGDRMPDVKEPDKYLE